MVEKYGKYILINKKDLAVTERFFAKYGDASNLIGRFLPVVRTFISFPAGLAKAEIKRFMFYALLGSAIWSFVIAYAGEKLGQNWVAISSSFHYFNIVLGALILAGIAWYVYRHLKHTKLD